MSFLGLLRRYPRYLSFGFSHYFFSFVGQTFFISLFVAGITAERGWTTDAFAGLYSGVTLTAALLLPLIGRQIDRFRVRYVSTVTALTMAGGCLLLAATHSWWWLTLGLLAVRLGGQGVMTLTGSTTIGRFFTRQRGKALSLAIVGISAAEVVIPPLATAVIEDYGYRRMWWIAGGLLLVVFLPLAWTLISRNDLFQRADTVAAAETEVATPSWTRGQVLADRRFQLIVPTIVFIPFVFTGFVFNQSDIALARGYEATTMAWGLSVFGLTRLVALFTAGSVVDRYGAGRLLPVVLLPAAMGLVLFIFATASWTVPATFLLLGLSAGTMTVVAPALWAERYGPRYLGSIKSTVGLLVVLSSAAAPIVFSRGLRFGIATWLWVIVGYAGVCVLLAFMERNQGEGLAGSG